VGAGGGSVFAPGVAVGGRGRVWAGGAVAGGGRRRPDVGRRGGGEGRVDDVVPAVEVDLLVVGECADTVSRVRAAVVGTWLRDRVADVGGVDAGEDVVV